MGKIGQGIANLISLALGAAGVRWSGEQYGWIFETIFYFSVVSGVVLVLWHTWLSKRPEMILPTVLIAFSSAGLIAGIVLAAHRWPYGQTVTKEPAAQSPAQSTQGPPPLEKWFTEDFPNVLKLARSFDLQTDGGPVAFRFQIYDDPFANSFFVGAYIPDSPKTALIAVAVAEQHEKLIEALKSNVKFLAQMPTQQPKSHDNLVFSRQAYIYHETHLSDRERADVRDVYTAHKLEVDFRGPDWRMIQWMRARDKK